MYKVVRRKALRPTVTQLEIEAPLVARKAKPGQFIILRVNEEGERIPLTVAGVPGAGVSTADSWVTGSGVEVAAVGAPVCDAPEFPQAAMAAIAVIAMIKPANFFLILYTSLHDSFFMSDTGCMRVLYHTRGAETRYRDFVRFP